MNKLFYKWFGFQRGEFRLVIILGLILFANYAAMGITKVVSVTGFLSEVEDHYILLVWAVDMVLLILAASIQSLVIDRFNRIKLMLSVLALFAILYSILPFIFQMKFIPSSVGYTLIYLLNDQQWRFFPIIFWILVSDILDPTQGRRLLPIIANFAFMGTIFGLGLAEMDALLGLGTVKLLFLNASIFGLALLICWLGLGKIHIAHTLQLHRTVQIKETFTDSFDFIKKVPAFSYLALSMLAAGSLMTMLLYETLSDVKLGLNGNFAHFYAIYNLSIAVGSIFVQSFTGYLIKRIGLKNSFLIQPFIMMGGIIVNIFLYGSYTTTASTQGVARINYETTDLSSRKEFQALIPNERRGRVSMFIDNYLPSLGTIIGSIICFTVVSTGIAIGATRQQYTYIYLGIGVLIGLFAIYSAFKIRATYDDSLLSWQLKRRTKGASVLDQLDFTNDESK